MSIDAIEPGTTSLDDQPPTGVGRLFPPGESSGTGFLLGEVRGAGLPDVVWLGALETLGLHGHEAPSSLDALAGPGGTPLLPEHSSGRFARPGLRGHRRPVGGTGRGLDWSPQFVVSALRREPRRLVIEAEAAPAGLALSTDVERIAGGALRARHTVTNTAPGSYALEGLEVVWPIEDRHTELLDFTGRHGAERTPQRHAVADGLWLREGRRGKTACDSATMVVAGTPGFSTTAGSVVAVHVAWSGNSVLWVERDQGRAATIGGGELLLPGEVVLEQGESYTTPWVYVVASPDGLDGVAAALHTWQRSQPAHPDVQPVTLNVWEAVYFDHEIGRLKRLADLAARVGVERYVLDDGWFRHRRNDHAGLGDWYVDEEVFPDGLTPLIEHVHGLGLEFGLWFEPEMINPDSDLYRSHPDWALGTDGRIPRLQRNQLVLDLTNPEALAYILDRVSTVLSENAVDAVKWDHNRDLLDGGSPVHGGAAAIHAQTEAFYALLRELRARHPNVAWESCAGGGGRVDLGVLEQVQRVWTSDMTDALARQRIQRWTAQLAAPEYLGAHVSAPASHQTGRVLSLGFRAATALFCAFGIEWNLTAAAEDDLDELAAWIRLFKQFRPWLHSGRMVRPESSDPAVLLHGVVAADRRQALLAHVQMDDSSHTRGVTVRVPGLDQDRAYRLSLVDPEASPTRRDRSESARPPVVPQAAFDTPISGAVLASVGVPVGTCRPQTIRLLHLVAVD